MPTPRMQISLQLDCTLAVVHSPLSIAQQLAVCYVEQVLSGAVVQMLCCYFKQHVSILSAKRRHDCM